jgi:hypothetical protein
VNKDYSISKWLSGNQGHELQPTKSSNLRPSSRGKRNRPFHFLVSLYSLDLRKSKYAFLLNTTMLSRTPPCDMRSLPGPYSTHRCNTSDLRSFIALGFFHLEYYITSTHQCKLSQRYRCKSHYAHPKQHHLLYASSTIAKAKRTITTTLT